MTVLAGQTADVPRDPECRQVVAVGDHPLTGRADRPVHARRPSAAAGRGPLGVIVDRRVDSAARRTTFLAGRRGRRGRCCRC